MGVAEVGGILGGGLRLGAGGYGKRRGEIAEAAFLAKVASLGFTVSKTWGDSDRYDFVVDGGAGLRRVQVKSAHREGEDGGYSFRTHDHGSGLIAGRTLMSGGVCCAQGCVVCVSGEGVSTVAVFEIVSGDAEEEIEV